jgi:hypothetical protein
VGVSSTDGGTTDKEGFNVIEPGSTLTIRPQAEAEFHFHGWRGDAGGEASPLILKPEKDTSVVAVFKPDGMLKTVIKPESAVQAGAGWKLNGQLDWRPSGDLSRGIDPGTYQVVFKEIAGFKTPAAKQVTITSGKALEIEADYEDEHYGYLVIEEPATPSPVFIRWRLDGEQHWRRGTDQLQLEPGSYRIWFAPRPGLVALPVSIRITAGDTAAIRPDYLQLVSAPRSGVENKPAAPLLFNPGNGIWTQADGIEFKFGGTGAWPVAGDYDGNGKSEPAIWHPRHARWRIKGGPAYAEFGRYGDIPAPADFDGDRQTDPALYRPETGQWFVILSSRQNREDGGSVITTLPDVSNSFPGLPLPADYLGRGQAQAAVYIPESGLWYIDGSAPIHFGHQGFVPAPGDYDGDGVCEPAMVNLEKGFFLIKGGGRVDSVVKPGDLLSVADFDGDGRDELTWYRPMQKGAWNVLGRIIIVGVLMDMPAIP